MSHKTELPQKSWLALLEVMLSGRGAPIPIIAARIESDRSAGALNELARMTERWLRIVTA